MNIHLPVPGFSFERQTSQATINQILQIRESMVREGYSYAGVGTNTVDHEVFLSVESPMPASDGPSYDVPAEAVSSTRQETVINTLSQARATIEARNNVDQAIKQPAPILTETLPTSTSTQPEAKTSVTPFDISFYEEALNEAMNAHGDQQ